MLKNWKKGNPFISGGTFLPPADDTYDLGSSALEWKDIYIDGTANIDTLSATTLGGAIAGGNQSFTNVGDMTFAAGSILAAGTTNADTLLIKAGGIAGTTFITLTSNATDTMSFGAFTLAGAVAGGDQAFTGVGDMTFTDGSILAAVDGAGTTLLVKAGGLSGTTFITLTSQSAGTDTMGLGAFTLGGTVTLNGQVLDAGNVSAVFNCSGAAQGLEVDSTTAGVAGGVIAIFTKSGTPANNDLVAGFVGYGYNNAGTPEKIQYSSYWSKIISLTDGAETGSLEWNIINSGTDNQVMTLSGAGVLAVDLAGSGTPAQVDLFDDYDDALVLRQGIQQNNRELLADIGVLDRKETGSGYMVKIQPMFNLLGGGIYQTRQLIENTKEELVNRIEGLERKIMLLEAR